MSVLDPDARLELEPISGPPQRPRSVVPWARFIPGSFKDMTWGIWLSFVIHPFKRGVLGDAHNRYGTPVSTQRCRACGRRTWWTPAIPKEIRQFNDVCLADECPSYDPHRDVSFLFDQDAPVDPA